MNKKYYRFCIISRSLVTVHCNSFTQKDFPASIQHKMLLGGSGTMLSRRWSSSGLDQISLSVAAIKAVISIQNHIKKHFHLWSPLYLSCTFPSSSPAQWTSRGSLSDLINVSGPGWVILSFKVQPVLLLLFQSI